MATVLNMPSAVSIPCFIPASKASETQVKGEDIFNDGELDFDLLAEYLLEETIVNGPSFDFPNETPPNIESPPLEQQQQPHGSVVTPEGGLNDFADPLADSTFQINFPSSKTRNDGANKVHIQAPKAQVPQSTLVPLQPNASAMAHAPAPLAPAPLQPAPLAPAPPTGLGMTGPPSLPGIVPANGLASAPQQMIVHQHKRPRLGPNQPVAPVTATSKPRTAVPPTSYPGMNQMIAPRTGRQKSQAQIDRRRERNRILARRTRLRKKFFFESLQKEVTDLQNENFALKEIVRTKMEAEKSKEVLDSCKANEELPDVVLEQCGDPNSLGRQDFNLMSSIRKSQQCFVISDPSLQDNPIVYASDDFLALTGYTRDQVLGRNCRFLQGPETDKGKVDQIRKALQVGDDVTVTFINYTAEGTPFWNKLFIAALRDAQNNIVNYIGVSVKVAGPEPGDPENGKLLPGETAQSSGDAMYMDDAMSGNENDHLDADAAVMAIEGAVTAAVMAAPKVVQKVPKTSS